MQISPFSPSSHSEPSALSRRMSYCGLGLPMLPGLGVFQGKVPRVMVVSVCPKPSIMRMPVSS